MFGLGPTELILILVVVVFLFGAKKLPDLGRALGQMRKEYGQSRDEVLSEESDSPKEDDLVDAVKDQLMSRLPGVGQINRIKKTVQRADKVVKILDKESKPKS